MVFEGLLEISCRWAPGRLACLLPLQLCLLCLIVFSLLMCLRKVFLPHLVQVYTAHLVPIWNAWHRAARSKLRRKARTGGACRTCWVGYTVQKLHNPHPFTRFLSRNRASRRPKEGLGCDSETRLHPASVEAPPWPPFSHRVPGRPAGGQHTTRPCLPRGQSEGVEHTTSVCFLAFI